ncbi:MAG: PD40 domain-containing protein [Planctomycetes bacterium]|nr:PD40 domain-containing protein [Planctomycetota bacterium]
MKKTFLLVLVLALGLPAGVANADFTFGTPTNLGPTVNTSVNDLTPRMPADGLSLYFASNRGGGSGGYDLWVMTRPTTSDPWATPVNLGPTVNSSAADYSLSISADDRTLYFVSNRGGGSGGYDLWPNDAANDKRPLGHPSESWPDCEQFG